MSWIRSIVTGPDSVGTVTLITSRAIPTGPFSASAGADTALLVVEPTVAGVHDLERVLSTTEHFGVPAMVVINKADLNPRRSDEVAAFCAERGIKVAGRIPYDTVVTEAMVRGQPVTAYADGAVSGALREVWERVREHLALKP